MGNLREPKFCSSLNCSEPNSYCIECSHAWFEGKADIDGKKYAWGFNSHYGPEFTLKGEGNIVPEEEDKIWDKFEAWLKRLEANYKKFGEV